MVDKLKQYLLDDYSFTHRDRGFLRVQQRIYLEALKSLKSDDIFLNNYRKAHPNNSKRWYQMCSHEADHWNDLFTSNDRLPTEIELQTSDSCLLNCWYCCSPNRNVDNCKNEALYNKILDYFNELDGIISIIQFSGGGEPLMDPYFHLIVKAAYIHKYHVRLNTSGLTKFTNNSLHNIIKYCNYIAISLDAHNFQLYNEIKKTKLTRDRYNKYLNEIKVANQNEEKQAIVELVVLVLPENIRFLEEICILAQKTKCNGIRFRKLKQTGQLSIHSINVIREFNNAENIHNILNTLNNIKIKYSSDSFAVNINIEDFSVNSDGLMRDNSTGCYSCFRKFVIASNGTCAPCAFTSYYDRRAKVRKSLLPDQKTIFDFENFKEMWEATFKERSSLIQKACSECNIADRYLNNFIQSIKEDHALGLPISGQFYSELYEKIYPKQYH